MRHETRNAINCFLLAEQLKHQAEEADRALDEAAKRVPSEELQEYMSVTGAIILLFAATCLVCTPIENPPGAARGSPLQGRIGQGRPA